MNGALGDNQSQQYQKDAHKCKETRKAENGNKGEFADLILPMKELKTRIEPILDNYRIGRTANVKLLLR